MLCKSMPMQFSNTGHGIPLTLPYELGRPTAMAFAHMLFGESSHACRYKDVKIYIRYDNCSTDLHDVLCYKSLFWIISGHGWNWNNWSWFGNHEVILLIGTMRMAPRFLIGRLWRLLPTALMLPSAVMCATTTALLHIRWNTPCLRWEKIIHCQNQLFQLEDIDVLSSLLYRPVGRLNIKMSSSRYRDPHVKAMHVDIKDGKKYMTTAALICMMYCVTRACSGSLVAMAEIETTGADLETMKLFSSLDSENAPRFVIGRLWRLLPTALMLPSSVVCATTTALLHIRWSTPCLRWEKIIHCQNQLFQLEDINVLSSLLYRPVGRLNIKRSSYWYRDPHVKDKMVSRPSYL